MRRVYQILGALLLSAYALAEGTGWELPTNAKRGVVPASARTAAGFRSFTLWNGGK